MTHRNAYIDIKVVAQDGNELSFRCKFETRLRKLMAAFCQRQGMAMASVRFLFDGHRINEHQTAIDLQMENGDLFDVMVEQQGD